jgi:ABC-2 type transport system ATP-binding protein
MTRPFISRSSARRTVHAVRRESAAVVEAHGVAKRYGSLVAVEDLTFAAQAGEVLGVLGPNGAGKTSAIRVLTTILEPSRGTFSVAGIPHTSPNDIRRRIGVLPESAGYPERETGEEYLVFHARLYGRTRAGARAVALSLLDEVGLAERGRSQISSYSRGMRQRLGIARALVNDPDAVFLDEPTLGLDPAGQRQILGSVRRIAAERGTAVLLSTHLLAEVEENCSRVLILNRGRVVADGTVAEVARRAAAPRSGRLRVASDDVGRATTVLRHVRGVQSVTTADAPPGSLTLALAPSHNGDESSMNEALRALLESHVDIVSFELEGARLSDAFLSMTGAG